MREDYTAPGERDDCEQAFRPAVGAGCGVGCCGAEAEEDGVAGLAGDEGAVGVEEGGIEEARDEEAEDDDVGGVGERYGGAERGAELGGAGMM